MNIIGINTLVYMDALRDGATQSELLGSIAELGVTLAEVRREYIAGDDEFNAIANAARINGLRLFYSVPESITVNGDVNPRFEEFLDEAQRMGASNVRFNCIKIKKAKHIFNTLCIFFIITYYFVMIKLIRVTY